MSIPRADKNDNKDNSTGVAVTLTVGGKKRLMTADLIHDDDALDELAEACGRSRKPIQVCLEDLWRFDARDRLRILDFIFALSCVKQFATGTGEYVDDMFDAVLALLADDSDLRQHEATKSAAIEAAAICHPRVFEPACGRIAKRLREVDVKGVRVLGLVRNVRAIVKNLEQAGRAPCEGVLVRDVLPAAPVSDDLVVPPKWENSEEGIVGFTDNTGVAVPVPILIVERHLDVDRDVEYVTLAWPRDGVWKQRTVPRAAISSTRAIVDELAPFGLPVTSNNAKIVVQ